jgi:hypothetical protein
LIPFSFLCRAEEGREGEIEIEIEDESKGEIKDEIEACSYS